MQSEEIALTAKGLYEVGRLHGELGDFPVAIEKLKEASKLYAEIKDHRQFMKCETMCMRMYVEMEDEEAVRGIKAQLDAYVAREGVELISITYYTLALCESYQGQQTKAQELLEKALEIALKDNSKEDMCYAIHGLAVVYSLMGRTEDALKELYNLKVFFQVLKIPELEISAQILNGYLLIDMRKYDEALNIFWATLEELRTRRNLYSYASLLVAIGYAYMEQGDADMATVHLKLAYRMCDPKSWVNLTRRINELLQKLSGKSEVNFDLVFSAASNAVFERKKGKIDFKNQFILMDMLKLFLKNPGEVYSKESLVKAVWKQEYDPRVHDNKIYVTIKRLRQLIEPDFDKPKYIYRAKNGYYLNRNAKVSFEQ